MRHYPQGRFYIFDFMTPIYLGSNIIEVVENSAIISSASNKTMITLDNLQEQLQALKHTQNQTIVIDAPLDKVLKTIQQSHQLVIAGGGVVTNNKDEILLIHRRGYWDLPKGKLDSGENISDCAIREVHEETGISDLTINEFLDHSYHLYDTYGEDCLKITHWYSMTASSESLLIPQSEEDIDEVRWVKRSEIKSYYPATYATIRDILERYLKL